MTMLDKSTLLRLFHMLDETLASDKVKGELYLVGGAVMCLALDARASTRDVDALFLPASKVRAAAKKVGDRLHLPEHWLNDGVKAFLSPRGSFSPFLDLSHLKVYIANPDYLLAMKCLSMRIGEEFHDIEDVRFLLRTLNLTELDPVMRILEKFYPIKKFPQKTLYVLEDLLGR